MPATRSDGPSAQTIVRVVFIAAAALLVLYAIYLVRKIVLLVFIAGFLAVGFDPAVRKLQKLGLRRGHAVGVLTIAILLTLGGFIAAVLPQLISQITEFATNLPDYVTELAQRNDRISEFVEQQDLATKLQEATSNVPGGIGSSFGTVLGVAGSVLGSLFNALTVIVLTIYFSLALDRIHEETFRLIPRSKRERARELIDPILDKIGGYIAGNVVISIVAGVVSFIFLVIAGVPFPLALALWVAIADLIPLVGATLGAVPAVIVAFFTSLPVGIATLVFFVIYQQLENYVIAPRIMKRAIDLSPAAVLLAALGGAALLGAAGVLMAIPIAAAIKLLSQEVLVPAAEEA